LLATRTILYIGFSFTDAYLNELRSEVMSLFGGGRKGKPLCYAIMNDTEDICQDFYRRHDGLHVLNFSSNGGTDFSGFDTYMEKMFVLTNPVMRFGAVLHKRALLWLHTDWASSVDTNRLFEYLLAANTQARGSLTARMERVSTAAEAAARIEQVQFDCCICCFDTSTTYDLPTAGKETLELVMHMRLRTTNLVPILVFGYDYKECERRKMLLNLGCRCYTPAYYELLAEMDATLRVGSYK
jgi:hypothetical protein